MPGRYIRDGYLDSERIAAMDVWTERFFFRLMLLADDYGRYTANPVILRNKAFPAHADITLENIRTWLESCVQTGAIEVYEADGKPYLSIPRFGQKAGRPSKYPAPTGKSEKNIFPDLSGEKTTENKNLTMRKIKFSPNINNINNRDYKESINTLSSEKHRKPCHFTPDTPEDAHSVLPFEAFWELYGKKTDRCKCEKLYSKIPEKDREVIKARLPDYVKATPQVQYRKNPQTWLNGKCWQDDIILNTEGKTYHEQRREQTAGSYGPYIPGTDHTGNWIGVPQEPLPPLRKRDCRDPHGGTLDGRHADRSGDAQFLLGLPPEADGAGSPAAGSLENETPFG